MLECHRVTCIHFIRARGALSHGRDAFSSHSLVKDSDVLPLVLSREPESARGIKGCEGRDAVLIPKSLLLLKSFVSRGCHGVLKLLCLLLVCYYIYRVLYTGEELLRRACVVYERIKEDRM